MRYLLAGLFCIMTVTGNTQRDTAKYIGHTLSNVDYHHGQLTPVVGCIIFRPFGPTENTLNGLEA